MTHVCSFFSQNHHILAAWSYFSSTFLSGSGHVPPLESKEEKSICWFAREIVVQKHLCTFTFFYYNFAIIYNVLVFQPVLRFYTSPKTFNKPKIILWAPIYALSGHICIYHIAKRETISLTNTIANCSRAQKAINLNFFPLWMNPSKNESILPGRRTSVGFYEPVRASLRDVSARPYLFLCRWSRLGRMTPIDRRTIINVHESPAFDQQHIELAFLDR